MPSIKVLRYTVEEAPTTTPPVIQQAAEGKTYAIQSDVEELRQEIKTIRKDIRKYMLREVDDADE